MSPLDEVFAEVRREESRRKVKLGEENDSKIPRWKALPWL